MPFPPLRTIAAALATGLILTTAAPAQDTPEASEVMATVNGVDITLGHMIALRSSLPAQYDQLPPQILLDGILSQLIQQTVLMQSVEGDLSPGTKFILENETRAVISSVVFEEFMDKTPMIRPCRPRMMHNMQVRIMRLNIAPPTFW